jgi:hypothetical protein
VVPREILCILENPAGTLRTRTPLSGGLWAPPQQRIAQQSHFHFRMQQFPKTIRTRTSQMDSLTGL